MTDAALDNVSASGNGTNDGSSNLLLEAVGITKSYGNVQALRGVNLDVREGEIVALIGDNGAGKSTLAKILAGVIHPDGGRFSMRTDEGLAPVSFASPLDARQHGIETIYQDLALCNDLDATANLFLGREIMRTGLLGWLGILDNATMRHDAGDVFDSLGVDVRGARRRLSAFSGGQRQGVAVCRAATWARKIVVMDEPTAALGVRQTANVLDLMRRVRDRGTSVILISHNMTDVLNVADRIQVMRLGQRVAEFARADATTEGLVTAMTSTTEGKTST